MQDIAFFDTHRTGELMNRLSEDIRLMKDAATNSVSMALRSVASLILGTAAMFYTSWQLSTLTLGLLPVTLIAVRWVGGLGCPCSVHAAHIM
jgi:ABC-type multidrug transport system fused ATPase/permease subunit